MPYQHKDGTFGHSIDTVRAANPDASVPNGCDCGDFVFYQETVPVYSQEIETAIESAPVVVDGVLSQNWNIQPLDVETVFQNFGFMVTNRLNQFARAKGYDSILSACSYVGSSIPRFAQEGRFAADKRDHTWAAFYDVVEQVKSGKRPTPRSFAEIESLLPSANWPL